MSHLPLPDAALERRARRNAAARLGWMVHALVYVSVNGLLWAADVGRPGTHLGPWLGWGLGLALHGLAVWLVTGGAGVYDRLLARERARLATSAAAKDPW